MAKSNKFLDTVTHKKAFEDKKKQKSQDNVLQKKDKKKKKEKNTFKFKKFKKKKVNFFRISLVVFAILILGTVSATFAYSKFYEDKIFDGVKVLGINASGKSVSELVSEIRDTAAQYQVSLQEFLLYAGF